jgi:hypothetical protein
VAKYIKGTATHSLPVGQGNNQRQTPWYYLLQATSIHIILYKSLSLHVHLVSCMHIYTKLSLYARTEKCLRCMFEACLTNVKWAILQMFTDKSVYIVTARVIIMNNVKIGRHVVTILCVVVRLVTGCFKNADSEKYVRYMFAACVTQVRWTISCGPMSNQR